MTKISPARPNGHVWMAAAQFYDAAETLIEGQRTRYPLPIVMNYAFAAELALKSAEVATSYGNPGVYLADEESAPETIIGAATRKSTATGHNLASVFGKLAGVTQTAIASAFLAETHQELKPLLDRCANYFVDVRYLHEQASGAFDIGSIETLARGLLNAVTVYGGGSARVGREPGAASAD